MHTFESLGVPDDHAAGALVAVLVQEPGERMPANVDRSRLPRLAR